MEVSESVTGEGRPWTVYVLAVVFVIGSVAGLVLDDDRGLRNVLVVLAGLGLAYAIWIGQQWAFSTIFMLSTLCAALLAALLVFQLVLYETGLEIEVLVGLISSTAVAALLVHPASKRFASFTT